MQKIVFTQDAARRIVAAGSTSRNVCRQTLDASRRAEPASRVNDARPVKITSEWTEASNGVWRADARFVCLDGSESDATLAVFRYATQAPPSADATAFVVWRGRWELVSAPPGALKIANASPIWGLTPLKFVDVVPAGKTISYDDVVNVRAVVESTAENGGIAFVSGIECVDGKLVVTTRYLRVVVDKNQRVAVDPTASTVVVSDGVFPVTRVSVVKTAELE
ncbi:MAG: hypothetical protein IKK39_09080 [Thermoguttaceae bacterium]|nr:hypothetical protein [Thermoguttaceae bacterium]